MTIILLALALCAAGYAAFLWRFGWMRDVENPPAWGDVE